MLAPYMTLQSALNLDESNVSVSRRFVTDIDYFKEVNMVMLQRQVSNPHEMYFNKFIHPLSKTNGMWVIYNIDDVIHKDDIPKYNKAWGMYQDDGLMENVSSMLLNSDIILTTTEYIKQYYHDKFKVELDRIKVIPNYIPHWWMGGYYDINKTMKLYNLNRKKPRVGVISSSPHYDINNNNNGVDDLTHIADFIRSTVNKYQWVFMGTPPPALKDLVDARKVEVNSGCDVMTYPFALSRQNLNAIVAPLEDNTFNRCKSNIKLIEGWAMGIPVLAQNLPMYSDYTDMVFDNGDDLSGKLDKLLKDQSKYKKIVRNNFNRVDIGDKNSPNGWWFERNMDEWISLFKMRSKCLDIDVEHFLDKQKNKAGEIAGNDIEIIS
jgi:glycosyltransferase involved in cell wall biosynthesis